MRGHKEEFQRAFSACFTWLELSSPSFPTAQAMDFCSTLSRGEGGDGAPRAPPGTDPALSLCGAWSMFWNRALHSSLVPVEVKLPFFFSGSTSPTTDTTSTAALIETFPGKGGYLFPLATASVASSADVLLESWNGKPLGIGCPKSFFGLAPLP